MFIYRPILEEMCTLHELRTVYTLSDLRDFHEALNLKLESEYLANKEAGKKK